MCGGNGSEDILARHTIKSQEVNMLDTLNRLSRSLGYMGGFSSHFSSYFIVCRHQIAHNRLKLSSAGFLYQSKPIILL
jgi:hypothetical protein